MAKGYGKPKMRKGGADAMSRLQQMQADMQRTQEALADEYITVSAGGGALEIEISGTQRVRKVTVAPELLQDPDPELLGDILVAAINEALEQSQTMAATRLDAITGGFDLGSLGL